MSITVGAIKQEIVWVTHNFGFLGGSLGCAEGEKITRAFEYAVEKNLPVCVQVSLFFNSCTCVTILTASSSFFQCRSGGARMQEGTSSLMQMAKVSVAVQALSEKKLPFISVLCDPTFGGVSASYAMQADVRIAVTQPAKGGSGPGEEARIGFAGPAVILNTMCEGNQARYDEQCPADFQCASFVRDCGQVDMVLEGDQAAVERTVARVAHLLTVNRGAADTACNQALLDRMAAVGAYSGAVDGDAGGAAAAEHTFNYTRSRLIDRPQTQDILQALFTSFFELR